jgi:hypothetical protein
LLVFQEGVAELGEDEDRLGDLYDRAELQTVSADD